MRKGKPAIPFNLPTAHAKSCTSPLKPEELQVLRSQYEKEGEYVGVQTKFNYAWVDAIPSTVRTAPAHRAIIGSHQVVAAQRTARRRAPPFRDIPQLPGTKARVPLLPGLRKLQAWQLRGGKEIQRSLDRSRAGELASRKLEGLDRRQSRQGRSDGGRHLEWCRDRSWGGGRHAVQGRKETVD